MLETELTLKKMLWLVHLLIFVRMLQGSHKSALDGSDGGPEFAEVFVIIWLGASVVTLNSKLLGGTMWVSLIRWLFETLR